MSDNGFTSEHSWADATAISGRTAGGDSRKGVLLIVLGVWIVLAFAWVAVRHPSVWRHWGHRAGRASVASQSTPPREPTDDASDYAYLGQGQVELGGFSVRVFDPVTRTALLSEFLLEADTDFAHNEGFVRFMAANRRGLDEQVMVTVRSCTLAELSSPDITRLEKKLAVRLNRVFGRHLFDAIRIKDFTLFEAVGDSPFVRCTPGDR